MYRLLFGEISEGEEAQEEVEWQEKDQEMSQIREENSRLREEAAQAVVDRERLDMMTAAVAAKDSIITRLIKDLRERSYSLEQVRYHLETSWYLDAVSLYSHLKNMAHLLGEIK